METILYVSILNKGYNSQGLFLALTSKLNVPGNISSTWILLSLYFGLNEWISDFSARNVFQYHLPADRMIIPNRNPFQFAFYMFVRITYYLINIITKNLIYGILSKDTNICLT